MTYTEIQGNLFDESKEYVLVHCISADFALGAGIAKQFADMGVKKQLKKQYSANKWRGKGYCLMVSTQGYEVANLVTKDMCYNKPTLASLEQALLDLKRQMAANKITKIAMPQIGCGIDKLRWADVSELIKETFEDTDVDIHVWIYDGKGSTE